MQPSIRFPGAAAVLAGLLLAGTPPARTATVPAARAEEAMTLDGVLDEAAWAGATVLTDFRQRTPGNGAPPSERTEARIVFDALNLYVGVHCFDAEPQKIIATERRRDAVLDINDSLIVILDPYRDRRTGFLFETNPLGARLDALVEADAFSPNADWDGVWEVATRRTSDGWVAEYRIPFETLRFNAKDGRDWGVILLRRIRRKNEEVIFPFLSRERRFFDVSEATPLAGIANVSQGRAWEFKPYVLAGGEERPTFGQANLDEVFEVGLDLKRQFGPNVVADLTLNTDFAQTEVDTQQVNLTRFPLFFPEKREFFLDQAQAFEFGRRFFLQPFFSRRIGLAPNGEVVPILAGVRLVGKLHRTNLAALSVQTDRVRLHTGETVPETNVSVLRLSQDILSRSSAGLLVVNREPFGDGDLNATTQRVVGADVDFRFFKNSQVGLFVAKSESAGEHGHDLGGQLNFGWQNARWRVFGSHILIQDHFRAAVGFVPRPGIVRTSVLVGYAPRPRLKKIREFFFFTDPEYFNDTGNDLLTRHHTFGADVTFESGELLELRFEPWWERLDESFFFLGEGEVPPGVYRFNEGSLRFITDASRKVAVNLGYRQGGFFNGRRRNPELGIVLLPSSKLSGSIDFIRNEVKLPADRFTTDQVRLRISVTPTTRIDASAFVQYNSLTDDVTTNLRFRWQYKLDADLFVVYTERRDVEGGPPHRTDRQLVVKWTYRWTK